VAGTRAIRREIVLALLIAGAVVLAMVANERLDARAFDPVPPARVAIDPGAAGSTPPTAPR